MTMLFSSEWMAAFQSAWNAEPELASALERIGFNSVIGYGLPGEPNPRGVMVIENGKSVAAGPYQGQSLNWDLRANEDTWVKWLASPPGMMGLGAAYTTGKIKFLVGDYAAMIKDPRMAGPFIKSFQVMAKVPR